MCCSEASLFSIIPEHTVGLVPSSHTFQTSTIEIGPWHLQPFMTSLVCKMIPEATPTRLWLIHKHSIIPPRKTESSTILQQKPQNTYRKHYYISDKWIQNKCTCTYNWSCRPCRNEKLAVRENKLIWAIISASYDVHMQMHTKTVMLCLHEAFAQHT